MGFGVWAPALPLVPFEDLFALPSFTSDESNQALAQDWYLSGLSAPEAVEIPWTWISGPLRFRQDKAITYAAVTATRGSAVSVVESDEQLDFSASLDTVNVVDAGNLAHFITTYYDTPRTRIAALKLILNIRTVTEIWTILGVGVGTRITITDTPVGWPDGAGSLVVEGIKHSSSDATLRTVEWSTSPLVGETVGEVGPFFRVGASALGGTDLLPW
jgi:hypothetical protein